jgi:L-amino acid N-acyltransferase YncA
MRVFTRPATPDDAEAMCGVINPIIAEGSTTAHRNSFDAARMVRHYIAPDRLISCTVAQVGNQILGFQVLELCDPDWDEPHPLPADWAVIASFVSPEAQGKGAGRALFAATLSAARTATVPVIDATIRADNVPGLAYYTAMGFEDYGMLRDVLLSDGQIVDQIRKRYNL